MFTPISNHQADALKRLMSQYANSDNLKNLISALVVPIQEIETALGGMNTLRAIGVATGVLLDQIGKIVGLERPAGDTDDEYRNKLYAEIKINTSEGQPEQAIQTFQLFTGAALVILTDSAYAEVTIASEYTPPDQDTVDLLLGIIESVLPAGVRCDGIIAFDASEAFAYDGSLPGLGYGEDANPLTGGKYPFLFTLNGFFAYDGNDPKGKGYGAWKDPLAGGWYDGV